MPSKDKEGMIVPINRCIKEYVESYYTDKSWVYRSYSIKPLYVTIIIRKCCWEKIDGEVRGIIRIGMI